MNLQVLLVLVFLAAAFAEHNDDCSVLKINGTNYDREILKQNIKFPVSLSYDRSTNSLFMQYEDEDVINARIGARINLTTNELEIINGVEKVRTVSVDSKTNNVYIEAGRSFYKYDKNNNKAELYVALNRSIALFTQMLFVKDDIVYFTAYPPGIVCKIVNGEVFRVKDLETAAASHLVIDDNDNMFFFNDTGLYRQKVGSQDAIYYELSKFLPHDGITINNAGDVYAFTGFTGIYYVSKDTDTMERVLNMITHGLTFDSDDNIIYSDHRKLYRFKPNNDPNCV